MVKSVYPRLTYCSKYAVSTLALWDVCGLPVPKTTVTVTGTGLDGGVVFIWVKRSGYPQGLPGWTSVFQLSFLHVKQNRLYFLQRSQGESAWHMESFDPSLLLLHWTCDDATEPPHIYIGFHARQTAVWSTSMGPHCSLIPSICPSEHRIMSHVMSVIFCRLRERRLTRNQRQPTCCNLNRLPETRVFEHLAHRK